MSHVLTVGSPSFPSFMDPFDRWPSGDIGVMSADARLTIVAALSFFLVVGGAFWHSGNRPSLHSIAAMEGWLLLGDGPPEIAVMPSESNAPAALPPPPPAEPVQTPASSAAEKTPDSAKDKKESKKSPSPVKPAAKSASAALPDLQFPEIDLDLTLDPKSPVGKAESPPAGPSTSPVNPSASGKAVSVPKPAPPTSPLDIAPPRPGIIEKASKEAGPPIPVPDRGPMPPSIPHTPGSRPPVVTSGSRQAPPANKEQVASKEETVQVVARSRPLERGRGAPKGQEHLPVDAGEPIASSMSPAATSKAPARDAGPPTVEYEPLDRENPRYIPVGGGAAKSERFDPVGQGQAAWLHHDLARRDSAIMTTVQKLEADSEAAVVVSYDVKMYVAIDGDSLRTIAQTMYRDPSLAESLAKYNRMSWQQEQIIPTGTRVRIPPPEVLDRVAGATSTAPRQGFQRIDRPVMGLGNRTASGMPQDGAESVAPASLSRDRAMTDPASPAFDESLVHKAGRAGAEPGVYRVERMETLWAIAKKTLGDGRRWREIHSLNRDRLTSETNVPAGTVLRLPSSSAARD